MFTVCETESKLKCLCQFKKESNTNEKTKTYLSSFLFIVSLLASLLEVLHQFTFHLLFSNFHLKINVNKIPEQFQRISAHPFLNFFFNFILSRFENCVDALFYKQFYSFLCFFFDHLKGKCLNVIRWI